LSLFPPFLSAFPQLFGLMGKLNKKKESEELKEWVYFHCGVGF